MIKDLNIMRVDDNVELEVVKRQPTFVELFAGCGGEALGMMRAGLKCLGAMERDPMAALSFWRNLCYEGWSRFWVDKGDVALIEKIKKYKGEDGGGSIFEEPDGMWLYRDGMSPCLNMFCWDIDKIGINDFCEVGGFEVGDVDLVTGGPPCQGFSTSNSKRSIDDPRNRLVYKFYEWVNGLRPKLFNMENVPGLMLYGRTKTEEGLFPREIRRLCKEYGYEVEWKICDAKDYGVPQSRRRVFFHGVRIDEYEKGLRFPYPEVTHDWDYWGWVEGRNGRSELEPYVTVREAIGDLQDIVLKSGENAGDLVVKGDKYYMKSGGKLEESGYIGRKWDVIEEDHRKHFKECKCGKLNIVVRKKCHYCRNEF